MLNNGFERHSLGEILINSQYGLNTPSSEDGTVPIFKMNNFNQGEMDPSNLDKVKISEDELNRYKLERSDILFNRTNSLDLVGKAGIFDLDGKYVFASYLVRLKVNPKVAYAKYINYFLNQDSTKKRLKALATSGVSQANINPTQLKKKLFILLPPLSEQKKIAQILSTWDKAITTTEKLLASSEQQKKALMEQILTGKKRFAGAYKEWLHNSLRKLVRISKGQQLNRSTLREIGKYPVINGGIAPSGYSEMANRSGDTITISEGGNSCGFVSYQKNDFWCGGHCYALCDLELTTQITYQLLKFNENKIMKLRVGSGLPNIQKKDLENLIIYYPTDPVEQQKISSTLFTADEEIRILKDKIKYLQEEKKALMQQLLTGNRRVSI